MRFPYKYMPCEPFRRHFEPFEPFNEPPFIPSTLFEEPMYKVRFAGLSFISSRGYCEIISDTECGWHCGDVPYLDQAFHWDELCHQAPDV